MEVEFVRNLNHNYLKIEAKEDFFEYQVQMLIRNDISGLLDCIVERVDNDIYFLYEINSKQPFVQIFERRKMNFEEFKSLILCLKEAIENVGEYLLDVNSLIIAPEYIYMNPESKEVSLIYIPGSWHDIREEFRGLAAKLLDWIDYKDEQVVTAAYELHRGALVENFSLDDILWLILDKPEDSLQKNIENKIITENKKSVLNYTKEQLDNIELDEIINIKAEHDQENIEASVTDNEEEKRSFLKKLTEPVLLATENLLKGFKFINKDEELDDEDDEPIVEKVIRYDDLTDNYDDLGMIAEEEMYGNTVFFQAASNKKKRLVPYDDTKHNMFELNIFPFIIGKLADAVDGVIDDESVSRIHAKIEKVDGQYYIVDLNSTNGTFLNGIMLVPNEKTKLQTKDRLQFGFIEYSFEND